ncbi:MAG TPA: hypothetical protein VFG04_25240 [Planctomycetaceae bacterium]|jgi:hypothetical protein|nr:hypothetical protein [Planctomycetaceae bacterium]
MATCPNCSQAIDFVQTGKTSIWKRNLTPGLGLGSLIAIAVIVSIFSQGQSAEIRTLSTNVRALEQKVDALTSPVMNAKGSQSK